MTYGDLLLCVLVALLFNHKISKDILDI